MDIEAKKKALRMLTYGLYVLTARHGDDVAGATVTWLAQASFEPPLVMVGDKADTLTHACVKEGGSFAINILEKGQSEMAEAFFRATVREGDKINGYQFVEGTTGCPILVDVPAYFECKVTDIVERGDHSVVVGEVVEAGVRREAEPFALADTPWSYGG